MEWLATNWSWTLIAGGVIALHVMTMVLTAPTFRPARVKTSLTQRGRS